MRVAPSGSWVWGGQSHAATIHFRNLMMVQLSFSKWQTGVISWGKGCAVDQQSFVLDNIYNDDIDLLQRLRLRLAYYLRIALLFIITKNMVTNEFTSTMKMCGYRIKTYPGKVRIKMFNNWNMAFVVLFLAISWQVIDSKLYLFKLWVSLYMSFTLKRFLFFYGPTAQLEQTHTRLTHRYNRPSSRRYWSTQ